MKFHYCVCRLQSHYYVFISYVSPWLISYVSLDSFHTWAMTHLMCVPWLISYVCHDSFHMCATTHFICVTWLISHVCHDSFHTCAMTHLICEPWLISHVCHDSQASSADSSPIIIFMDNCKANVLDMMEDDCIIPPHPSTPPLPPSSPNNIHIHGQL